MPELVAYLGELKSPTRFITEQGEEIRVLMYRETFEAYSRLLPMKCYVLLEDNIVKEIVAYN